MDPKIYFLGASVAVLCVQSTFWRFLLSISVAVAWWVVRPVPKRLRRMSFSSEILCEGGFPSQSKAFKPLINIATYFDDLPSVEDLAQSIQDKFVPFVRFSSVPVFVGDSWEWNPVEVDVSKHIHMVQVSSEEQLQGKLEELMVKDLRDPSRPQWEFIGVRNTGKGRSCMLVRLHHALGDGLSFVSLFMETGFLQDADGNKLPENPMFKQAMKGLPKVQLTWEKIRKIVASFVEVLTLGVSKFDSPSAFNSPNQQEGIVNNGQRKIVILPTLSLARIKALKNKAGATVNDVMMSLIAGVIHRYCKCVKDPLYEEDKLQDLLCRALLPVAMPRKPAQEPRAAQKGMLRNLWCFVSAKLAVEQVEPLARLKATQNICNNLKESPTAFVQLGVQDFLGPRVPYAVTQKTAYDTFNRHSLVFSNVPGPPQTVSIAGKKIVEFQMLFPNLISQVGILSYRDDVTSNFVVDPTYVKEYEKVCTDSRARPICTQHADVSILT